MAIGALGTARAERTFDRKGDVRGPFDVRALSQNQRRDNDLLFALVTRDPWRVEQVKNGGFAIRVDSDRDGDFDRFVLIEWKNVKGPGGKLRARIVLPTGEVVDRVPAFHPKPRRLSLWIDHRDLGIEPGAFRINAYSIFYGGRCPDDGCRDEIPNQGRLRVAFGGLCADAEPDVVGTPDDDKIRTVGRRVVVASLGGDDVVRVERGSAIVCGGKGRDVLVGGPRADHLDGGRGPDTIRVLGSGRRPNEAFARAGNDLLYGGDAADRMFAGPGDDFLTGRAGDDFLDGGRGDDDIRGGSGTDVCRNGTSMGGC